MKLSNVNITWIFFILTWMLTSCEDYNEINFPGYKENAQLIVNEAHTLSDAEYKTIGNYLIQRAYATYLADSALVSLNFELDEEEKVAEYNTLYKVYLSSKADAQLVQLSYSFKTIDLASNAIQLLMPDIYKYADPGSAISVSYRTSEQFESSNMPVHYQDVLLASDYTEMGTAANKPGQYKNFSATTNPNDYLPAFCKNKHPYAVKGEIARLSFQWYAGGSTGTVTLARFYQFDGEGWSEVGKTDQFIVSNDSSWIYDPTLTFTTSGDDFLRVLKYLYAKYLEMGGSAGAGANISFSVPELEGYNQWTSDSKARFVINWKYPPAGAADVSNVYTEYFFGTSWKYNDLDLRTTTKIYADDIELQSYFASIDSTEMTVTEKNELKRSYIDLRAIQGYALLLSLKYPDLTPEVSGVKQIVNLRVDEYDGAHKYWIYTFKCVEKGKFEYVDRIKWK